MRDGSHAPDAEEPAKPLTAEERGQLQKEAAELDKTALRLYRDGQYAAVTDVLEKSLAIQRKLYPTDKYPKGRPEVAASLSTLAYLYQLRGEYDKAEAHFREALGMRERLFPAGHPDLATNLNNLGFLLDIRGEYAQAEPYYREALAMRRRLYPADKYPNGQADLALSILNLGYVLDERGEYAQAEPLYREALAMRRRLYPTDKYPNGRPELAASLGNLAALLQSRGESGKAEALCREALDMCRRLYPTDKYPNGYPQLAASLDNMGYLSKVEGEYDKAAKYYGEALAMYRRLYPTHKYPDGRPELAATLSNLGGLMETLSEYDKAERFYQDALAMRQRLYPADKYPDGHADLAASLNNLGVLRRDRGEYSDAETYFRDALKMRRRLYPADKYPDGHPDLAQSLNNLGELLVVEEKYDKAAEILGKGLTMYDRLMAAFAASAAEAEAINLAASRPRIHSGYLAATAHTKESPADCYALLWRGKGGLARTQEQRRRLLRAASTADADTRRKVQTLLETRQDLARLILAPPGRAGAADRAALLQELTDQKERLEKELAGVLPASERATAPYTDLANHLSDKTAFIDCYRYWNWNPKTRQWDELHYTAFVLRKNQPVRRVELAQGAAIESDLKQWRQDIDKNFASDAASRLRKNLWAPIAQRSATTYRPSISARTVRSMPCRGPALPADRPGHVLLEDTAFAVVPSGPFLLNQLARPLRPVHDGGELLVVGGVAYDRAGVPTDKAGKPWPPLPATDKERGAVVAQAGKLPRSAVVQWSGSQADVSRVLTELPKVRWRTWPRTASSPPREARNVNISSVPTTSCTASAWSGAARRRVIR